MALQQVMQMATITAANATHGSCAVVCVDELRMLVVLLDFSSGVFRSSSAMRNGGASMTVATQSGELRVVTLLPFKSTTLPFGTSSSFHAAQMDLGVFPTSGAKSWRGTAFFLGGTGGGTTGAARAGAAVAMGDGARLKSQRTERPSLATPKVMETVVFLSMVIA